MRKFNLTSRVARRIAGLEKQEASGKPENSAGEPKPSRDSSSAAVQENGGIRIAWRTDIGKVRRSNQDAVILGNGLAGIADGMGGHLGGEIASGGLRDGLLRETENAQPDGETLKNAIEKVNHELWEQQEHNPSLSGMGTTLTVLWPAEREMLIAQVGDSRAYLMRNGELKQITQDHSMVADMVRRGVLTEEQAACHPMRNYITRAVGTDEIVETDITRTPRQAGDRWLICSDGLYGLVTKADLAVMVQKENLEEAANALLDAALANGGRDNISLVLMEDVCGPKAEADPSAESEGAESNESGGEVAP